MTAPPLLVFAFWAYAGVFNNGAAALALGLPMLWADAWWIKQVWAAGPADRPGTNQHPPATAPPGPERRPPHQGLLYLYPPPEPSQKDQWEPARGLEPRTARLQGNPVLIRLVPTDVGTSRDLRKRCPGRAT